MAMALTLLISAWSPTVGASDSTTACDGNPAGDVCAQGPDVPVSPIDRDEWVPRDFPDFPDIGFDDDESSFTPDGYASSYQQLTCAEWTSTNLNSLPDGCSSSIPPPAVSPSDPPCGPDGSWVSQYLPQTVADACIAHDVCYSQLSGDKERCDDAFDGNLLLTCERQFPYHWIVPLDAGYLACVSQVTSYSAAVRLPWASSRFQELQREAQCRQWHQRRENESDCS